MLTPELSHIHSTVSWACESRVVSGAGVAGRYHMNVSVTSPAKGKGNVIRIGVEIGH